MENNMDDEERLNLVMRRYTEDNVIWSRFYAVSLLANLPDLNNIKERLIKDQEAMGNCMREFFGDIVADNFIDLRKEHVNILLDLLLTIKEGDILRSLTVENDIVINIDNTSTLLSTANPYYIKEELTDIFNTCVILAKYGFMARISGDYNAEMLYYDMSLHQAIMLSDYLVNGIAERFSMEQINEDTHPIHPVP